MTKQILFLFAFAALVYAQAPLFTATPSVAVGEGSGHLVLADVNRDGKLDLIAQHLQQRMVTVQLGDGAGRFTPAPGNPIRLGYMPGEAKVGDLNGDGIPDLGIIGGERDAVDILFGDGGGKFTPAPGAPFIASTAKDTPTTGLQLLDLNEDGKLDVLTTGNQRHSFATLFGNGRGGFTAGPVTSFPTGAGRYTFAFGDFDGDKHLDAAIANSGGGEFAEPMRVVVLRGDGKGAFSKLSETNAPFGPRYLTPGDVNGDGRLDLVFVHGSNEHCGASVWLNQGGGKFVEGPSYDLGGAAYGVTVADVNQDKRNDLIVATVDSVTVLLNGNGKFAPAPGSPFRAGPGAYHLAAGDVNGDGKPDVAASSFEGKTVTMLLGK